jgi:hypothetical protein
MKWLYGDEDVRPLTCVACRIPINPRHIPAHFVKGRCRYRDTTWTILANLPKMVTRDV